jgi:hypothetical protein
VTGADELHPGFSAVVGDGQYRSHDSSAGGELVVPVDLMFC